MPDTSIPPLDFDAFDVLSFDCYGTIVDWETGLWHAISPVLAAHHLTLTQEQTLEQYAQLEARAEAGAYRPYRIVLKAVLEGFGVRFGFTPTAEQLDRFSASVGAWPPFSDSADALRTLQTRYKLAIVSNVDDDLFAGTAEQLGVPFDWVITAQQSKVYKPSLEAFRKAIARIGVPTDRLLHVAQSLFHDIAPAKSLGLSTVWINRRSGRRGVGATPPAEAMPDLELPDLYSLAQSLVR